MHDTATAGPVVRQYFEHPPRSHLYEKQAGGSATPSPRGDEHVVATATAAADGDTRSLRSDAVPRQTLSALMLTGIMYTFTIGGAYGIEESVLGGGPLLTILSIVIIPLLMSAPCALIVAEMGSAIPSNAGFLMWINLTFHRVVYFATSILSLLLIFVDNALYPVLFSEYLCTMLEECPPWRHSLLRVGMIAVTFIFNVLGIEAVGLVSVVLTAITVSPFVLAYLTQQLSTGFFLNWPAIAYVPPVIEWSKFITTASWNLSGLEQAGTMAEDVQDPQRTIIQALIPLLGLALVTYIPPILTGASTDRDSIQLDEWVTGFWSEVAYRVGGSGLMYYTVFASVLSAFGLTLSAICTTTRLISGMALTEVFPGKLGVWLCERNERFGTYHWSLIANTVLTAVFSSSMDFSALVELGQFLYGVRVIMIFIAFFVFREKYPHVKRPFRVPLEGWKLYAAFALPFLSFIGLTAIAMAGDVKTFCVYLATLVGTVVVSALYCTFVRKESFHGRIVTVRGE